MFLFWCFDFLLFYFSADGCMYMTISGCVCACVCKWLILYIWCSLMETWTMSHFDFSFLSSTLWTLHSTCGCSENYAREWFSDCWMWFYWERSSVDWLFVRVNNKKKAILFNFLLSNVWGRHRSGALVCRREASPLCRWVGVVVGFVLFLTDVASLFFLFFHLSTVNDQSFEMLDEYHMQTSWLDKT